MWCGGGGSGSGSDVFFGKAEKFLHQVRLYFSFSQVKHINATTNHPLTAQDDMHHHSTLTWATGTSQRSKPPLAVRLSAVLDHFQCPAAVLFSCAHWALSNKVEFAIRLNG